MSDNASEPQSPSALAATAKGSPVFLWDVGPLRYSRNRSAVARMSSNLAAATSGAALGPRVQRPASSGVVVDVNAMEQERSETSSDHEARQLVELATTDGQLARNAPMDDEGSPLRDENSQHDGSSPHRVSSLLAAPLSKYGSEAFGMRKFLSGRLSVSFGFDPDDEDDANIIHVGGTSGNGLVLADDSPNKAMQQQRRSFLTRAMLDTLTANHKVDGLGDEGVVQPSSRDAFMDAVVSGGYETGPDDADDDGDDVCSVSVASHAGEDDDHIDDVELDPQTVEVDEHQGGVDVNDDDTQVPSAIDGQLAEDDITPPVVPSPKATTGDHKHSDGDGGGDPPPQLTSMSSFYSRVMKSYRSALEDGAIVLEHSPFHTHLTPQQMQGDATMYDEENMRKRHALQEAPATVSLLQAVWDAMPKVADAGKRTPNPPLGSSSRSPRPRGLSTSQTPGTSPSALSLESPALHASMLSAPGGTDALSSSGRLPQQDDTQVVTYNVYRAMSAYVFRRLVPTGNADAFLQHCATDWKSYAAPSIVTPHQQPLAASNSGNTSLLASIQKMLAPAAKVATPASGPPPSSWVMNKSQFFKAMFSIVDVWTESADAEEYHDFMHRVLLKQAKKITGIDPHAFFDVRKNVFASGAFRKQRVVRKDRRVSRTPQARSPAQSSLPGTKPALETPPTSTSNTPPSLSLNVFLVERTPRESSHPVHERAKDKLRSAIDRVLQPHKRRGTRFTSVFQRLTANGSVSREEVEPSTTTSSDANEGVHVLWTGITPDATKCPLYDFHGRPAFNLEELCAAITIQDETVQTRAKPPPSVLVVDDDLLRDDAVPASPDAPLPVLTQRNGSRMIVSSVTRMDDAMEQLAQEVAAHVLSMVDKEEEPMDLGPLPIVETPPADHEMQHLEYVAIPQGAEFLEIPTAPSPVSPKAASSSKLPPVPAPASETRSARSRGQQSTRLEPAPTLPPAVQPVVDVGITATAIAHHSLKGRKFVRASKPNITAQVTSQHQQQRVGHESAGTTGGKSRTDLDKAPAALTTSLASETQEGVPISSAQQQQPQYIQRTSPQPSPVRFAKREAPPSHHSTRGPRPPKFRYETAPSALVAKRKHYRQECGEVIAHDVLAEGLENRRNAEKNRARDRGGLVDGFHGDAQSDGTNSVVPSSARTQASASSLTPQEQLVSTTAAKNPRLGVLPEGVRGNLPPGALRVVRTVIPRIVPDTKTGKIIVVVPDEHPQHRHYHHRGPIPPAPRGAGRHPVQLMVYEHYDRPYLDRILLHPELEVHQKPSALREAWRTPRQLPGETLEAILCNDAYKYPKGMTALARAAIQEYETALETCDEETKRQLERALPTKMHQMMKYVVSQRQSETDSTSQQQHHSRAAPDDDNGDGAFGSGHNTLAMHIASLASQQNPNLLLLALLSAKQREELDARDCNRQRARSLGHLGDLPTSAATGGAGGDGAPLTKRLLHSTAAEAPSTVREQMSASSNIPVLPPISSASPRQGRASQDGGGVVVVVRSPPSQALTPHVMPPSSNGPQFATLSPPLSAHRAVQQKAPAGGAASSARPSTDPPSWDQQMSAVVAAGHCSPALTRGHLSTIPGRHATSVLAKLNDHQQSASHWSSKYATTTGPTTTAATVPVSSATTASSTAAVVSVLDRPNLFRTHPDGEQRSHPVLDLQRRLERNDPTLDPAITAAAYSQAHSQLVYEIECEEDFKQRAKVQSVLSAVEHNGAHSRLRQHAAQAGRAL